MRERALDYVFAAAKACGGSQLVGWISMGSHSTARNKSMMAQCQTCVIEPPYVFQAQLFEAF